MLVTIPTATYFFFLFCFEIFLRAPLYVQSFDSICPGPWLLQYPYLSSCQFFGWKRPSIPPLPNMFRTSSGPAGPTDLVLEYNPLHSMASPPPSISADASSLICAFLVPLRRLQVFSLSWC